MWLWVGYGVLGWFRFVALGFRFWIWGFELLGAPAWVRVQVEGEDWASGCHNAQQISKGGSTAIGAGENVIIGYLDSSGKELDAPEYFCTNTFRAR